MNLRNGWMIAVILVAGCGEPKKATLPTPQITLNDQVEHVSDPDLSEDTPGIESPLKKYSANQFEIELRTVATAAAIPAEFSAKIIEVIDGDTIDVVTDDKKTIRIRLNGIDAPETDQPFENNAWEAVDQGILNRMVIIRTHGDDRYGRTIGDVYVDGTLINRVIVSAGLA